MKSGRAFVLIAMVMNAEWAKAEGDTESFNQFGSQFGGTSGLTPQGPQAVGTFQAAFEVRTNTNGDPRGKQVKQDCAVCHKLSVLINGREYGDGEAVTLPKGETHTVKVKDTPVPRDTPPGGDSSPPHTSNQKFTVWPQAVDGQTITSIQGNGPADSPQVFIAKKAEILQYLLDNSEGLMAQDKDWPENPADEPMNKTARLLPVDIDFIHPATGEMDESRETSEGGYIAIRRDEQTPVTKLKLRKLDGMANAQFKLVFSSNKIKLWKQFSSGVFSEAVASDSTPFPANQDTEVFVEGVTKSDAAKDVEVGMKVVIGSTESSPVPVKLTVVQAEIDFQIKFWIREDWVDVPFHPINNLLNDRIAGGDDRDGSTSPTASYRVTQKVTVNPFRDLDLDGIKDGSNQNLPGTSSLYVKATSVPHPGGPYSASNKLLPGATPAVTGPPDTSNMKIDPKTRVDDKKATVRFHGAANDPLIWFSFSIDWDIEVTVDSTVPLAPKFMVTGWHDNYPAIEIDMTDSDGPRVHAYEWLHPLPSNLWALGDGSRIDVPSGTEGNIP